MSFRDSFTECDLLSQTRQQGAEGGRAVGVAGLEMILQEAVGAAMVGGAADSV